MFTGIIEEIGMIRSIRKSGHAMKLEIAAKKIIEDMHIGDSISVNGVCLTVTTFTKESFHLDVMPETFQSTSLVELKQGSKVNLERAMAANGRFGGHFVSGHVDGTGMIKRIWQADNAQYYEIETTKERLKYIIHKGSVAIDGTSLTVFEINDQSFVISLIPHTLSETILSEKKMGDVVNIECDMLGKYMEHFLHFRDTNHSRKTMITNEMLKENGFI